MRSKLMIFSVLAIVGGLQYQPVTASARNDDGNATVTVTEEGDSSVIYERPIFDFGPLNPGDPDSLMRKLNHRETKEEIEAKRQEAQRRDKFRIHADAPRRRIQSASSGGYGPDESRPVGKIPIQEGTTPTGARTYMVPIATAPVSALIPQLSLYYNSQSGQGAAGYGWSISGLPAITISNKTEYYNGEAGPADVSDPDAVFALDGMPLVNNSIAGLADEYQLETARGHIVVKKHMNGSKVSYFTALYPDGSRAVFGQDRYTASLRCTYPITELEDLQGNRIVFKYMPYTSANGYKYYISSVEYGFDREGVPAGRIEFDYEDDAHGYDMYYAGICTKSSKLLKSVSSYNGEEELCRYDLTHELDGNEYRLTSVECTSDGKSLNPLEFSYGDGMVGDPGYEPDIARKEKLILSYYFTATTDVDIVYKRGKFMDGAVGDGLIAYPNFPIYTAVGYKWNWFNKYFQFGSGFNPDQKIIVAPMLTSYSSVQSFEAGEGFQCVEAVDTDADGVDEIVQVNFVGVSGNTTVLKITVREFDTSMILVEKSSFTVTVEGVVNEGNIMYSPAERIYSFGDYCGNGKAQLLTTLFNSDFNSGQPRTPYSALIDIDGKKKLSEKHIIDLVRDKNSQCLLSLDIDNDGRTELCWATSAGIDVFRLSEKNIFTKTETLSGLSSYMFPKTSDKTSDMFIADFNGDGYPDFIYRNGGQYIVHMFTGQKFTIRGVNLGAPSENDELMFYDINRDGLADLIHRSGTKLYFYLNEKCSINASHRITSSTAMPEETVFLPCNTLNYRNLSAFATIDGGEVISYDFSQNVAEDRLLTMFTNSHDVVTVNEYEDMAASIHVYVNEPDRTYGEGYGKRVFSMYLLKNSRSYIFPAMTTLSHLNYRYFDAAYNWQGLRFCGFGKMETTDFLGSPEDYVTSTITFDPTMFGAVVSEELALWSERDKPFSTTDSRYEIHSMNPRLVSSTDRNALTGVTTSTAYTYGDYDLVSSMTVKKSSDRKVIPYKKPLLSGLEVGTVDSIIAVRPFPMDSVIVLPGESLQKGPEYDYVEEKTEYSYTNFFSGSLYLLGRTSSQKVTKSRPEATFWVERRTWEYDDELMLPTKITDFVGEKGSSKLRETRLAYDGYGNVTSETSASYNSSAFIGDSYTYDESGRLMLSHTDALGRTETYSGHNKFGKPTSVTDDKGRVTQITYDEWGNEISRSYPEGSKEETIVQWGGEGLYTVTRSLTGQPSEVTHYDAGDRVLRTGTLRFDGTWLYTDREYDEGRLLKVSMPFKGDAPSLWSTYEYDAYNRKVKFTEASGNVIAWAYDKWEIVETRNGVETTRTMNPEGTVVEVEDNGGRIAYVYRADGQPESVGRPVFLMSARPPIDPDKDSGSGFSPNISGDGIRCLLDDAIHLGYDDFGRRTSISDPSAGKQTDRETWAADGSSIAVHTNPNGTIITKRDKYGRVMEVDREGEYTTTYTYGADGLLLGETSTNGTSRNYTYDSFDRLLSETETVPDGKWLRKDYSYTSGSRVASVTYTSQSGEITTELYSWVNGHNTAVRTQDGRMVWSLMSENELGLPTKALTGTVERGYSYTPYGHIDGRTMGEVQDFGYRFSATTGNLMVRDDLTRGMKEKFGYDGLNRLTDANGQAIEYSENGNITAKWSVGVFSYDDISKPYQMTEALLSGDEVSSDRDQTISYTSFFRPSRLNEGGRSASFTYNGSHERVKMHVADGTEVVLTRYYIGDRYELDIADGTTVERLYLDGDSYSAPMVMVREDGSSWELLNIGRDHLGSITHLATYDGILVEEYSYDAWGRLRDPETHEAYALGEEPELLLGRGFTGHEHLPWFGLVNMNARLYDPALGCFLSPDPYIQFPDFTQSFNRYSYGLNNPLVYVDENGEFVLTAGIIIGVAALIGGTINLAVNWDNCDGPGQYIAAFGVGALGGAAVAAAGPAGFWAVAGAGALSSGLISGTNNVIAQTGYNFDGFDKLDWTSVGISAAIGAASGFAGSAVGFGLGNAGWMAAGIKSPALRSAIVSPLAAGAGHIAGGTTAGLFAGKSFEDAFNDSFEGLFQSMAIGGAVGVASTIAVSYANGINPWTGRELGPYSVYEGVDPRTKETKYVGITKREPNIRFLEHWRSNTPRANLEYNPIYRGISYTEARILEQTLINRYGLDYLYNKINSISPKYWDLYNIKP